GHGTQAAHWNLDWLPGHVERGRSFGHRLDRIGDHPLLRPGRRSPGRRRAQLWHGKIESLSAFIETVIMAASCVWIVSEAVARIAFHHHLALQPSPWPFVVLAVSMTVDYSRSRALGRIAREHRSDALAADSVHFATDMWASLAVMVGLAATYVGGHFAVPWLEYADPIAALAVAGVILRVSWGLARQTIDTL